jgi:hypothetical protein
MKYLLLFENFINEAKEKDGFTIYSYSDVKKNWGKYLNRLKNDEVLIFTNGRENAGILRTKFKLNKIKYRKFDYFEYDFIIKKSDVPILLKEPKKHTVKSFGNITKLDLEKIMATLTDSSQVGWTAEQSIQNCLDKTELNYPIGFKNIPSQLHLFRYLDVEDESKIKQHQFGVHYVTRKGDIDHDFLNSIMANEDHNGFIVEIETTKDQIDVNETIINNLYFPDENEITLKEDGKYNVIGIEKFED